MPDMCRYQGQTVLVTGGGSGIGEACCLRLASEGAKVAVLDIDGAHARAVAERIRADGGEAMDIELDVSVPTAVDAAMAAVVTRLGPLKLAVNLSGVFYCMRAEHPHLLAAGGGAIVNTASVHSVIASPTSAAYTTAKHGVLALTKVAALAWGRQGIRVNAVGPGFTPTPLTAGVTDAYRADFLSKMALDYFPEAQDIAATVAFLGSDEARAITGALQLVDGGFTIA